MKRSILLIFLSIFVVCSFQLQAQGNVRFINDGGYRAMVLLTLKPESKEQEPSFVLSHGQASKFYKLSELESVTVKTSGPWGVMTSNEGNIDLSEAEKNPTEDTQFSLRLEGPIGSKIWIGEHSPRSVLGGEPPRGGFDFLTKEPLSQKSSELIVLHDSQGKPTTSYNKTSAGLLFKHIVNRGITDPATGIPITLQDRQELGRILKISANELDPNRQESFAWYGRMLREHYGEPDYRNRFKEYNKRFQFWLKNNYQYKGEIFTIGKEPQ